MCSWVASSRLTLNVYLVHNLVKYLLLTTKAFHNDKEQKPDAYSSDMIDRQTTGKERGEHRDR